MNRLCECHYNLLQKTFNKRDHITALCNHLGIVFTRMKYGYLTFERGGVRNYYTHNTTITYTKFIYRFKLKTSLDLIRFIDGKLK